MAEGKSNSGLILAIIALIVALLVYCFKRQQDQGASKPDSKQSVKKKDSVKLSRREEPKKTDESKSPVVTARLPVDEPAKSAKSSESVKDMATAKDAMSEGETKDVVTAQEPESPGHKKAQTSAYMGGPMQHEANKSQSLGPSVEQQAEEDVVTALSPSQEPPKPPATEEPVKKKKRSKDKKKSKKEKRKSSKRDKKKSSKRSKKSR